MTLVLINCSVSNSKQNNNITTNNAECLENLDFKKEYFFHIGVIDSLVEKSQNKRFKKSLLFISKYSHVSTESMLNYARSYPIVVYKEDRKGWISWYEKNKCNNIQFKK
ncbi:hypothetical protein BCF50_1586 [Chryseobacterium daecheongense]|uniref:Lipoprotein n=1 Tax=Chryseobacterium daecheongense TaxID=192389 RepID=A0ABY2FWG6_9FLAO|nr:hypothetical protein BCF50_1586 [Chryseobacterium daecheongense]